MNDFGGVQLSEVRNKLVKIDRYIWFSGCSQNIDGWLQNYISYLIYSQILLNFLSDLLSLFLHLCMDDSQLAIEQKFLKEALRFRGEVEKEQGSQNYE